MMFGYTLALAAAFTFAPTPASSYDFNSVLSAWRLGDPNGAPSLSTLHPRQSYPQPILELNFHPSIMDATLKHFCLWAQTANPSNPNVVNISYSEDRRNDGECDNCCGTSSGTYLNGIGCHQAPFAKAYESAARTGCVDAYENAFQGWWLGQWFRDIKLGRNTAFGERLPIGIQVSGIDCADVTEADLVGPNVGVNDVSICSADNPGRIENSGIERRVIPPSAAQNTYDPSYSLVIVPLGDLPSGDFVLDATITGTAFDVRLWDNVGDDLVVGVITPNDRNEISLSFSGPAIGVGLMVATPDTSASVEWSFRDRDGASSGGGSSGSGALTTSTFVQPRPTSTGEGAAGGDGVTSLPGGDGEATVQPPLPASATLESGGGGAAALTSAGPSASQSNDGAGGRPFVAAVDWLVSFVWAGALLLW